MSLQSEIAYAHQLELIRIGKLLGNRTKLLWQHMDVRDLDQSWQFVAPQMVRQVAAAQLAAAELTSPYLDAIDRSYGHKAPAVALAPTAFTNVMGDGREIAPALYGAVTNMKTAIGAGTSVGNAFQIGSHFVAMIAQSALQDMARNADRSLAAGKGYTRYIRVVNGSACSRCAILAGMYSGEEAFLRHASCQCSTVPISVDGKSPKGFYDTPQKYFDSLSKSEQDRVFTNSGAEAIRRGADPIKVVNARRGAYGIQYSTHGYVPTNPAESRRLTPITIGVKADGSPLKVYATAEGKFRGEFRRSEERRGALAVKEGRYTRTTSVRVMPEQLLMMAGNNPARWTELLGRYGYLQ